MVSQFLLAAPALAVATSCVPQPRPRAASAPRVERRPAALLRELALEVPAGLTIDGGDAPLPPRIPPAAAPAFLAKTQSADDAARAMQCLTAAIYYEARSESADGQRAVAQVVLNRVRDRAFPNSVCGVVYQGSTRRTGCQFSFTCDGSMNARRESFAWERARGIAAAALSGAVFAPVGSATFYHADYVSPWWAASLARVGSVGAHIFYTWRGAMERALAFRQRYSGVEPSPGGATSLATATVGDGVEQEIVAGVTIHRPRSEATPAAAEIVAALAPPAAAQPVRPMLVSGVRIHLGGRAPKHIVVGGGGAEALVSEESDPG